MHMDFSCCFLGSLTNQNWHLGTNTQMTQTFLTISCRPDKLYVGKHMTSHLKWYSSEGLVNFHYWEINLKYGEEYNEMPFNASLYIYRGTVA